MDRSLGTNPIELVSQLMVYLPATDIISMSASTSSLSTTVQKVYNKNIYWTNRLRYRYPEYSRRVAIKSINTRLLVELLDSNAMVNPTNLLYFFSSVADYYSDRQLLKLIDFVSHDLKWSKDTPPWNIFINPVLTHLEKTRPQIFKVLINKCLSHHKVIITGPFSELSYEELQRNQYIIKLLIDRLNDELEGNISEDDVPGEVNYDITQAKLDHYVHEYSIYSMEILKQAVKLNDVIIARKFLDLAHDGDDAFGSAFESINLIEIVNIASTGGHGDILVLLLHDGDKRSIPYNNYYEAFKLAIKHHHVNIIRIFVNEIGNKATKLPESIYLAIESGVPEIVGLILEMKRPRITPDRFNSALFISYALKHYASKQILIVLIQHPILAKYLPSVADEIGATNDIETINIYLNTLSRIVSPKEYRKYFEKLILAITEEGLARQYYNGYKDDYGPNKQLLSEISHN
jgi:hypothetical protein